MNLYKRDYSKSPTPGEWEKYEAVVLEEKGDRKLGRINLRYKYPEAIRHFNSLFPNNHIELCDIKGKEDLDGIILKFEKILNNPQCNERDLLKYINHTAPFIMACLLFDINYGHHDAYLFPEFSIGGGKYYADYLIVGKNSGGYEFLFVELEAPNKRTTIMKGYPGVNMRSGLNQIKDWKAEIEGNYSAIAKEFRKYAAKEDLENEFMQYDSTRIHYAVISGRREDYNENTYRERRDMARNDGITLYHYDNVLDLLKEIKNRASF